jgi:hypothetical protein
MEDAGFTAWKNKTMKNQIGKIVLTFVSALAACSQTARADLAAPAATAYSTGGAWVNDGSGNRPFYSSGDLSTFGNFSSHTPPTAGVASSASLLAETVTITNGAGTNGLSASLLANTNYVLTGISFLVSGYSTTPYTIHIFDVTTNVSGGVTGSGAYYTMTSGDLLGGGAGLSWTNNSLSGAEQQVYLALTAGPNTDDQIVLSSNHIYSVEIWVPSTVTSTLNWFKSSATPQDIGGQGMGATNTLASISRQSGAALGFYGSSQHSWALALYGSPTSAAATVNNSTNTAGTINYFIDQFNSYGYGLTNTYVGTNNYNLGQITNVWLNWFGSAWLSNSWDGASDAQGNPNSGSLKISANFGGANSQFEVFNNYNGIKPALNGLTLELSTFECDVRFDPNSATSGGNFGNLQFGTGENGQDYFGTVVVPATTTNWVHVVMPINPATDTNLQSISDVLVHIYSTSLSGPVTFWVDNMKFVGPATLAPVAPPTMSVSKTIPGLRAFAGSSGEYDREELATVDQGQSWINATTYPVSYSFTMSSFSSAIGQTHLFLIPLNSIAAGGNVYGNSVDYGASNGVWLVLNPAAAGAVTASVYWKVGLPNANAYGGSGNTALTITNSTAIGTWTLSFTGPGAGTLTAPGAAPVSFTISDPNVSTDFANPMVAYFGMQPNSNAGIGSYEDYAQMGTTNTAGGAVINDVFANDSSLNGTYWNNVSVNAGSLVLVATNTPYWVTWSVPAVGFGLGVSTNIVNPNWMLPEYYNNYNDGKNVPNSAQQGSTVWTLIPSDCLPTVDGQPQGGQALSPTAYFRLFNPSLNN